jgi:hypothetical protein
VDIDAVVAKHGWALQAVLPDGPGAPPFTYTIGLFDRLPELLCVGPLADVAGPTLNALAALLQRRPDLARDGQHVDLPAGDGVLRRSSSAASPPAGTTSTSARRSPTTSVTTSSSSRSSPPTGTDGSPTTRGSTRGC